MCGERYRKVSSLAILLANPAAGSFSRSKMQAAAKLVRKRGFETEILLSSRRGEIEDLARTSLDGSPEMILVFGGDGTFNEAANGLVHSTVPVAFVPLGTANVLAKELKIPESLENAVTHALKARSRPISLGKVNSEGHNSHYFIMMAGAGFDADTVRKISPSLKERIGRGAYIVSGLGAFLHYDPPLIEVRTDGDSRQGYAVIVGNGGSYGGRFRVTPQASLFEPRFQVFILTASSRSSLLRTAVRVVGSLAPDRRDGEFLMSEEIELLGDAPLQTDGDYRGSIPARITVEPDCLHIIS